VHLHLIHSSLAQHKSTPFTINSISVSSAIFAWLTGMHNREMQAKTVLSRNVCSNRPHYMQLLQCTLKKLQCKGSVSQSRRSGVCIVTHITHQTQQSRLQLNEQHRQSVSASEKVHCSGTAGQHPHNEPDPHARRHTHSVVPSTGHSCRPPSKALSASWQLAQQSSQFQLLIFLVKSTNKKVQIVIQMNHQSNKKTRLATTFPGQSG